MVILAQRQLQMPRREAGITGPLQRRHFAAPSRRNKLAQSVASPPLPPAAPAPAKRGCQRRDPRSPTPNRSAASSPRQRRNNWRIRTP